MEVYVARQPIFDRDLKVYGYELLYRRSMNNFYEGIDDNQSTAELINTAFFSMQFDELTGGTKAFVNFSEDFLIKEIPLIFPKETIVIEILERINITDEIIIACKKLKDLGYTLALDDFVFDQVYLPLLEIVDIIKIEFPVVSYAKQLQLMSQYRHKIKFLAEKIETREEYKLALNMGYDYFQGYFFSKPIIIKGQDIQGLSVNLIHIVNELGREQIIYQKIAEIIETDIGLSYKLLKLANSLYFGSLNEVYSIKQALVRLGTVEIKKWVYLMMLKDIQSLESKELIKNSLIRGKFMELLSYEIDMKHLHLELFLTGLFSSIDVLLNRSMDEVLKELPFDNEVGDALLGHDNKFRDILNVVINYEMANWIEIEDKDIFINMNKERFVELYIEALRWVMKLDI